MVTNERRSNIKDFVRNEKNMTNLAISAMTFDIHFSISPRFPNIGGTLLGILPQAYNRIAYRI